MRSRQSAVKPARGIANSALLRPARRSDIATLCAIEQRAFAHDRLSARSFVRFLRSPRAALIVAQTEGIVSGYALTLFRRGSRVARLYSIAVDAGTAGRSLGSRLLRAAEAIALRRRAKAMRLEVKPSNRRARALYRKFGYRAVGELYDYYQDGGPALRLEKQLGGATARSP
jgi:ribosomal protein S18 acetylase RimI-like enzyme